MDAKWAVSDGRSFSILIRSCPPVGLSGSPGLDRAGCIPQHLVADGNNHAVRLVSREGGDIFTIAGTGTAGYNNDDQTAVTALLDAPYRLAVTLQALSKPRAIFFPREATTKQILLTLSVFVAISGVAFAENDTSGIDQRQTSQEQRADQGIASGQLNEREADRSITQREHINEMEAKAKSHGVMTERERDRIVAAQDRAAHHIAREKPDRRAKRHR